MIKVSFRKITGGGFAGSLVIFENNKRIYGYSLKIIRPTKELAIKDAEAEKAYLLDRG